MVHKLRARNVCNSSPRPSQIQGDLFKAAQSTPHIGPQHLKYSHKDTNNLYDSTTILGDSSNADHTDENEDFTKEDSDIDLKTTKYEQKLHKLVDNCIFRHTFRKRRGVSLYVIKKALETDHACKPSRFSKPVTRYIAFSIDTGKLQQITGHGASGTFRLSRNIHRSFARKLNRLRKVSSYSHVIHKRVSQKSKHNTVP